MVDLRRKARDGSCAQAFVAQEDQTFVAPAQPAALATREDETCDAFRYLLHRLWAKGLAAGGVHVAENKWLGR